MFHPNRELQTMVDSALPLFCLWYAYWCPFFAYSSVHLQPLYHSVHGVCKCWHSASDCHCGRIHNASKNVLRRVTWVVSERLTKKAEAKRRPLVVDVKEMSVANVSWSASGCSGSSCYVRRRKRMKEAHAEAIYSRGSWGNRRIRSNAMRPLLQIARAYTTTTADKGRHTEADTQATISIASNRWLPAMQCLAERADCFEDGPIDGVRQGRRAPSFSHALLCRLHGVSSANLSVNQQLYKKLGLAKVLCHNLSLNF